MCGLSADKIQVATGHVEISTITNHYIKTSSTYQKQLLELGNMDSINSLEVNKLKEIIMLQNQEILRLKERLNLENEEQTKNANLNGSKNEFKGVVA
ncbi:Uncharacterised protein [Metamycoplasma alkalescens]|nr:Uncharacterised protein [Metamycoplasma alkalescens]